MERFVVFEELISAGAPIAAAWFADRQFGVLEHSLIPTDQTAQVVGVRMRQHNKINVFWCNASSGKSIRGKITGEKKVRVIAKK